MCFGGSSSNQDMINLQLKEAAEARQKEIDRQNRINAALAKVKGAFEGTEVMKNVPKTFTVAGPAAGIAEGTAVTGLPTGYTYVHGPAAPATPTTGTITPGFTHNTSVYGHDAGSGTGTGTGTGGYNPGSVHGTGGGVPQTPTAPTAQPGPWMVKGPDGKLHAIGETIGYTGQQGTGVFKGGFDDAFYNKLRDAISNYYMPQVADQYKDAHAEMSYRLARAGLLGSSGGNEQYADLSEQNQLNRANIRQKADTAKAALKTSVGNQRAAAEAQIQASENPEVAANTALANVKNISAAPTDLQPLADIFDLAAVGAAGGIQQYNNQRIRAATGNLNSGATRII